MRAITKITEDNNINYMSKSLIKYCYRLRIDKKKRQRGNINQDAYNNFMSQEPPPSNEILQVKPLAPFHIRMNEFEIKAREMEKQKGKIPYPNFDQKKGPVKQMKK